MCTLSGVSLSVARVWLVEEVDFVQDVNLRLVGGIQFAQDGLDLGHLLGGGGTGGVCDLEQDGGALHLFQRGAEGGDQGGGQVADESDGVGEKHIAARGRVTVRRVGSKVANMRGLSTTPALVRALKRVDLPALV